MFHHVVAKRVLASGGPEEGWEEVRVGTWVPRTGKVVRREHGHGRVHGRGRGRGRGRSREHGGRYRATNALPAGCRVESPLPGSAVNCMRACGGARGPIAPLPTTACRLRSTLFGRVCVTRQRKKN